MSSSEGREEIVTKNKMGRRKERPEEVLDCNGEPKIVRKWSEEQRKVICSRGKEREGKERKGEREEKRLLSCPWSILIDRRTARYKIEEKYLSGTETRLSSVFLFLFAACNRDEIPAGFSRVSTAVTASVRGGGSAPSAHRFPLRRETFPSAVGWVDSKAFKKRNTHVTPHSAVSFLSLQSCVLYDKISAPHLKTLSVLLSSRLVIVDRLKRNIWECDK